MSLVLLGFISGVKGIFKGERPNYVLFYCISNTHVLWPNWIVKNNGRDHLCMTSIDILLQSYLKHINVHLVVESKVTSQPSGCQSSEAWTLVLSGSRGEEPWPLSSDCRNTTALDKACAWQGSVLKLSKGTSWRLCATVQYRARGWWRG